MQVINVKNVTFATFLSIFFVGCANQSSPACSHEYSNIGNADALQELYKEWAAGMSEAGKNGDIFMLQEGGKVNGNYYQMEEWVCNEQKKYGRPKN